MIWKIIGYAFAGTLSFILFYGGWQIFKFWRLKRKLEKSFIGMINKMETNLGGEDDSE